MSTSVVLERSETERSIAPLAYLCVNAPLVVAIFVFQGLHVYLWGLMSLGAAAAIVLGVVRNHPRYRVAWILIALGVTTFALGDISYDVLTEFLHESNPFPSIADGFYLATYLLLTAGLVAMVRARRRREGDPGSLLDALIVTAGLGALSWIYLIHPYVRATGIGLFAKLVSIGYPLGDILLLCVLIRLVVNGGTRNASVRLLTIGVLGVLVADSVYGWIQLHGSWKVGGPTDLGWVVFYLCWGAAALHPGMRQLTVEQPPRSRNLSLVTLTLLSAASLAAPILVVWRDVVGVPRDAGFLAGTSAVVFVLVMLRLTGVARSQAELARREQMLRGISERLVAANDRSAVWEVAVDAIVALGAPEVIGCVVTETAGDGDEIVASTWRDMVGDRVVVSVNDPQHGRRVIRLSSGETVAATPGATIWTQLELPNRDATQDRILFAHAGPLSPDLNALDSVAAQLTLALGRVELVRVLFEARTERRFHSMVKYSSDLITLLDAELRIVYESPSVSEVLGRSPDEMTGRFINELIDPGDVQTLKAQFTKVVTGGPAANSTFEYRVADSEGRVRIIDTVISNLFDEADIGAVVLNGRDVTDRRALEVELNHQAFHDTLTGLANRSLFLDRSHTRWIVAIGRQIRLPSSSWTWTTSRRSTTASAIRRAIACWSPSPSAFVWPRAPATRWRASVATNSPSLSNRERCLKQRRRLPTASSRR